MRGVLVALALCIAWALPARAETRVAWDCYLTAGPVDCRTLRGAYFAATPCVSDDEPMSEGEDSTALPDADARGSHVPTLSLRSLELPRARRYLVEVRDADDAHHVLHTDVAATLGADASLNRVLGLLHRATVLVVDVVAPGTPASDGALHLALRGAPTTSAAARPSGGAWHFAPSLGAEIGRSGASYASARGQLLLDFSEPAWRFRTELDGRIRHVDVVVSNEAIRGTFLQINARTTIARSLTRNVSVAVHGGAEREPQNNLARRLSAGLGAECLLVPMLVADENNVGARYKIAVFEERYVAPAFDERTQRSSVAQRLAVFSRWHTERLDVAVEAGAGAPIDRPAFWDVSGQLSVTWRVADALEVEWNANATFRERSLRRPTDPDALGPAVSLVSGNAYDGLLYWSELRLSCALGNALRARQNRGGAERDDAHTSLGRPPRDDLDSEVVAPRAHRGPLARVSR